MGNFILCSILFRVVLPTIILTCVYFRPCVLSALYLLLLLLSALVPVPTASTLSGSTGIYLKLLIMISTLTTIGQIVFQTLMLLHFKPYGSILQKCEFLERLLRHCGFIRLDKLQVAEVFVWVTPEVIMLITSIVFYVLFSKFTKTRNDQGESGYVRSEDDVRSKKQNYKLMVALGKYLVMFALCLVAVLKPSVPGGYYFLIFLCSATWWGCYRDLQKGFAIVLKFSMIIILCHIFTFYAYQTDWPQELLVQNSTYARYFGFTNILSTNCDEPRKFIFEDRPWTDYAFLPALVMLFCVCAVESKQLLLPQPPKKQGTFSRLEGSFNKGPLKRQLSQRLSDRRLRRSGTTRTRWQNATRKVRDNYNANEVTPNETTPLIQTVGSTTQKYGGQSKAGMLQDSTGSVIISSENPDDIPLKEVPEQLEDEDERPTCFEKMIYALESIMFFVIKSSYIGTNITMMAWSITYHSWLTFILLLWASILWMVPNQRKYMLRSSPFLVLYAWFLLISAYVYSMDLTEKELPTKIEGIDLEQIGFIRDTHYPFKQLLAKSFYTVIFWITLRQFVKERLEARQNSALADMVAPLQLSVGTAAGVDHATRLITESQKHLKKVYPEKFNQQTPYLTIGADELDNSSLKTPTSGITPEKKPENEIMQKFGTILRKLLTKFWIWVVAITLFLVAITGQRMTSFRIMYMALFLIFILSFQFSFRAWRKMMFGFWLTVIIYSMIILILVYTYQFNNFPAYWEEYLHVTPEQQLDIGLEKYETKQLFMRLVTPTFFVIIAVIQLHYFHKDFLELSKPTQNVSDTTKSEANSSAQGGAKLTISDENEEEDDEEPLDLTDIDNVSSKQLNKKFRNLLRVLYNIVNTFLLGLEIHMPKIVLFVVMVVCVKDVAAVNMVIVILLVFGATVGKWVVTFAINVSSLFAAALLLARMVYQIKYIDHDIWNVTCSTVDNTTRNDAEWLGLYKIDQDRNLPELVKWNIIHIVAVSILCIINIRQSNFRASRGQSPDKPFFMFPKIKITNAHKDMTNYLKYLANYCFYRMGVEICLIALVATIGIRMDLYALFYSFWLGTLFLMSRKRMAHYWNFFLVFIAVFIPVQYLMVIGLPPSLCIEYPWDSEDILRRLQEWAYLMDIKSPPPPKKLLCDFALLILVARQSLVFRIERRYANEEYAGGSNESIIHYAEDKDFTIPVPDFITYSRSYLDIFKKTIFLPFMWITLAIVFLAGTNRVNLFSIGYLLGSFYFLWQGSDIYLQPIPSILKKWNFLLGYNIIVIFSKVALQLIGCLFFEYMKNDACWVIQLFGISCLRKFKPVGGIVHPSLIQTECVVPREYVGLAWDGACFAFMLLQRRLFSSLHFFHIVNESKASAILASRGAELIEELRQKRMIEQDEEERRVIEKIKTKMDRIKATQQKILGPDYKAPDSHEVDQPPLARSSSMSTCTSGTSATSQQTGYHTPIDEEEEEGRDPAPVTPAAGSLLQPNAPSPFSAIMTGSLEGYLEPQRMSFSSPPNSELNPRPPSPDDSFPVFSPPPYDDAPPYVEAVSEPPTVIQRQHSLGPPWMAGSLVTPRQSVISYSSRSPISHHTYSLYPKSNRPMYRRKEPKSYKAEETFGTHNNSQVKLRKRANVPRAIRSGDYYMFDDIDNEDIDVFEEITSKSEDESELQKGPKKQTLSELLSSTLKTDVGTVVRGAGRTERKRRVSLPPPIRETAESPTTHFSAPPVVRIQEVKDDDVSEPQPSTSKVELSEVPPAKPESKCQKIMNILLFMYAFFDSAINSATIFLNRYSKDYRYVLRVLKREKKILKETTDYDVGVRNGPGFIWQPTGSYKSLLIQSREASSVVTPTIGTCSPSDSYRLGLYDPHSRVMEMLSSNSEKLPDSEDSDTKALPTASPLPYSAEQERHKASVFTVPEIRILAPSMERGLDSPGSGLQVDFEDDYESGEMSSYDQPNILRLLLALWYIVLSHSDLLCYFVIFLNQVKNATFLSLPLPIMVFFWGTLTIPRPSKTFWITIIAYTQIIVLIKCMFQFQILPWNRSDYTSYPFDATSIIGIERKKNYAVWDLLLLLVVYFHRFMLKCLGLWKASYPSMAVLADGEYNIENGELKPKLDLQRGRDSRRGSDMEHLVDESDSEEKVYLHTTQVEPKDMFPSTVKMTFNKYTEALKLFFYQLFDPTSRVAADVYTFMFICDFFNFFVILMGYSSFGTQQGDGGVSSYLEDNRVPVLFLLMLILQFLMIIVDRAIFLRKNIFAKIIFQFLQIFILHIWLFIIYPITTERSVNSEFPPQIYYMVKCFYLLFSAYQIRCGYPARILGNVLCKGYGYINMILFKGFMLIPFLFELRTVMDWMWTDTSMTVFDWIKMEDIFAHIYQLKCTRHIESEYPQPRGERKVPRIKYITGGLLLVIIIGIIWFPLVFFSLGNAVGKPNVPYDVKINVRLGPYEALYRMTAQSNSIFQFTRNDYMVLQQRYMKNKIASTFISNYEYGDIAAVKLSTDSATVWSISPPDQQRMIEEVESDNKLYFYFKYEVMHETNTKEDPGIMWDETQLEIDPSVNNKTNPLRQQLLEMLKRLGPAPKPLLLTYLMPKFAKVTSRGKTQVLSNLMDKYPDTKASGFRNITLQLSNSNGSVWWEMKEECDDYNYKTFLQHLPYADCKNIMLYTFNDKIFPATLNMITGGGIIGLYTTLVFVASRVLRGFFSEICFKIMFDDMPFVDRVLQLTLDIYLVREAREFCLEEDLFAKLVFLYRSPETLIKWTRPPEEVDDEDDPEGDANN